MLCELQNNTFVIFAVKNSILGHQQQEKKKTLSSSISEMVRWGTTGWFDMEWPCCLLSLCVGGARSQYWRCWAATSASGGWEVVSDWWRSGAAELDCGQVRSSDVLQSDWRSGQSYHSQRRRQQWVVITTASSSTSDIETKTQTFHSASNVSRS